MWMSLRITQDSARLGPSHKILPKITPVSVEETWNQSDQPETLRIGTDLDGGLDALEAMGSNRMHRRSFDNLEIAESGEVQAKILKSVRSLVDQKDI